ncbi:hypothetical protein [Nitratiruptor sp. YY09-18]|uniref:hypothetical protein n=1 Tax=Nitratiruptor sp. YY09-18 TaxID=2724901 RepID=UPI00191645DA|nr:hypothetical protein [Nitratiruptor sp. YY09-18]BCD68391.1 hypothetical protein NitYY0918_C1306 [Nitratiruptor sp. YY09-18]
MKDILSLLLQKSTTPSLKQTLLFGKKSSGDAFEKLLENLVNDNNEQKQNFFFQDKKTLTAYLVQMKNHKSNTDNVHGTVTHNFLTQLQTQNNSEDTVESESIVDSSAQASFVQKLQTVRQENKIKDKVQNLLQHHHANMLNSNNTQSKNIQAKRLEDVDLLQVNTKNVDHVIQEKEISKAKINKNFVKRAQTNLSKHAIHNINKTNSHPIHKIDHKVRGVSKNTQTQKIVHHQENQATASIQTQGEVPLENILKQNTATQTTKNKNVSQTLQNKNAYFHNVNGVLQNSMQKSQVFETQNQQKVSHDALQPKKQKRSPIASNGSKTSKNIDQKVALHQKSAAPQHEHVNSRIDRYPTNLQQNFTQIVLNNVQNPKKHSQNANLQKEKKSLIKKSVNINKNILISEKSQVLQNENDKPLKVSNQENLVAQDHKHNTLQTKEQSVQINAQPDVQSDFMENSHNMAESTATTHEAPEQNHHMPQFQRQVIKLQIENTLINVQMQQNSLQMQFVSGAHMHIDAHMQEFIDEVMTQSGFDKYRIALKDREKRVVFTSSESRSTQSSRSGVDVKV